MNPGLSPRMEACLFIVKESPGTPVTELPGGIRTVLALMRRELVERAPDDSWRIYEPAHDHSFKTTMHLDGCHWYTSSGTCDCGAAIQVSGERNPRDDPYAMVWMEDHGEDPCSRCDQLRAGAPTQYHVEIVGPRRPMQLTITGDEVEHPPS